MRSILLGVLEADHIGNIVQDEVDAGLLVKGHLPAHALHIDFFVWPFEEVNPFLFVVGKIFGNNLIN